ncbi:MAG: 3-methyl-2-oxobutanoate hydroxymethyltransferase [Pseudomonadota bacterium]
MVGLLPRVPTFVKRYGTMQEMMQAAVGQYADEVKAKTFPGDEHTYRQKG